MVDRADLAKANQLASEYSQISMAISNFDNGGRITSMIVSPPIPAGPPPGPPALGGSSLTAANVRTDYMTAPPQMIATLRTLFAQRQQEIYDELAAMGVTSII